jgi:hypothetical protein
VVTLSGVLAKKRKQGRPIGSEVEAHVSTFLPGGRVAEALSSLRIKTALQVVTEGVTWQ